MSRNYDPWKVAHDMGIDVIERRLPHGHRGEYWHRERRIVLLPGLSHREARSVLAHELQHAAAGDVPSPWGLITMRQELRARRATARALIDADEYAVAERLRGPHLPAIAHDLDVTIHVARDWLALRREVAA